MKDEEPIEGGWYETDTGEVFMVVAVDSVAGVIDVQYLDGAAEQLDEDAWAGLEASEIEPADEWRATIDSFVRERGRQEL